MRKKVTEHPASYSWKLSLQAKTAMETRTSDDISYSSQDLVHQSNKDFSQDHHANVSKHWIQVILQAYA